MPTSAGYSGTPLAKKLGIKAGFQVGLLHAPAHYFELLAPIPEKVIFHQDSLKDNLDMVHIFATRLYEFEQELERAKAAIHKAGMVWVSWPKKSSGLPTELNENLIRDFGLQIGLVDVKVCAVDETWSALKFVFRLKNR